MGNIQVSNPPNVPSPVPATNGIPQMTPSAAAIQSTPGSSDARIPNPVTSPARTPGQADKKSLARDLLRALKRPRPDTSSVSVKEPESKRHASEAAVNPVAQTIKAIPNTSMPSVQPATLPVTAALPPTKPTPQIPPAITVPRAATASSTIIQSSDAPAKPASTSATAQVTPPQTGPPTALTTSASTVTQNVPNPPVTGRQTQYASLSAIVRAQIKQATSFGAPVAHGPHHSDGADTTVGASISKFQVNPATKQDTIPGTSVFRSSKAPQTPIVEPTEPVRASVVPNTVATQPEPEKVLITPLPTTVAPAPVAGPSYASTSSTAAAAVASGSRTIIGVPETSVVDKTVGPSTKASGTMVFPPPAKVPLFLPSPTSSPIIPSADGNIPTVSLEAKGKGKATSPTASRSPVPSSTAKLRPMVMAHVLAPPLPEYAKKWKEAQQKKVVQDELDTINRETRVLSLVGKSRSLSLGDFEGLSGSRSPSEPVVFMKAVDLVEGHAGGDTEEPGVWDFSFASYDEAEKEVLRQHCSRLRESFCRWLECEVTVNTPGALLRHLDVEHGPRTVNAESPWTCQWTGCGYTVISRDDYQQHIEKHAVFPVRCPYRGCSESFRTPRQLIKHKRNDHGSDAVLRPTAGPVTVTRLAPVPPFPKILPSYMTEYRVVRPASISKQRHENILPSIIRRISGTIPAHLQRYNAARPMPMTPSRSQPEPPEKKTPYSFLEHRSTRYSTYLSTPARSRNIQDVDSSHVTNLTKKGLVLWPTREGEAVPEAMIAELEGTEEDAVERELLEEDGYDVFGPTMTIEPVGGGGGGDGVGDDGGVGGSYVEADPSDKSL
ncbi:hypothetical protein P691DRAFT_420030 [Macrolepiota fuliginosa MF-IS2]|uniref:C2H2-type domain-containing protein n=1 Tax=Macrolepiota fuliginosa MF-IS2 TaxID=1400762 RepID=A0A9P5XJZ3_9AGAR|nr:hypothetical protein P691DRAFT_420030 [Macrolepiota fuliginosa MF-IS2]